MLFSFNDLLVAFFMFENVVFGIKQLLKLFQLEIQVFCDFL